MTHRPFLQITLSTKPLGLEKEHNVTCQYVMSKRRLVDDRPSEQGNLGNGQKRKSSVGLDAGTQKRSKK
jgi:hypothetical protein